MTCGPGGAAFNLGGQEKPFRGVLLWEEPALHRRSRWEVHCGRWSGSPHAGKDKRRLPRLLLGRKWWVTWYKTSAEQPSRRLCSQTTWVDLEAPPRMYMCCHWVVECTCWGPEGWPMCKSGWWGTYRIAVIAVRVCGEDCIRHSMSGAHSGQAQGRFSVRLAGLLIIFHHIEMETCFVWSLLLEWPKPSGAASWSNVFLLFYMIISKPIWKNFFLSCAEIDTFP